MKKILYTLVLALCCSSVATAQNNYDVRRTLNGYSVTQRPNPASYGNMLGRNFNSVPVNVQKTNYVYIAPTVTVMAPVKATVKATEEEKLSSTVQNRMKCADQGMPTFQYDLAVNYLHGTDGIKTNRARAFELLGKAAAQDHKPSKELLNKLVCQKQ